MRYLITGGAGFVGSHLADYLINKGHHVHVLDNLSTGSVNNFRQLKESEKFDYTVGDLENESLVRELVDGADIVFHLAALVGVFRILEEPVETIETNIMGTRVVLNAAEQKKKRVLLTSTSEVYGKSTDFPYAEDDDMVMGPSSKSRWGYACSKAIDEFLGLSYWDQKNVPVIVTRLFNTVGPRQAGRYGMVIPRFVKQALKGGPITVFGDGSQRRCFAHVQDVVRGLDRLVCCDEAIGRVFNVGNDQEISIMKLAEKIRKRINPDVEITTVPYEEAYEEGFEDMPRRIPDLSRLKNCIEYEPEHTVDDILEDVIAHQKSEQNRTQEIN
jgi:UDP-glucose 4-epimerase